MATPVIMPRQGQSVETCVISQWYKTKGEKVMEGDLLFSYETDKAAFDKEAEVSGVLLEIFFEEGDEVPVLENIAVVGTPGEDVESFRPGGSKKQVENMVSQPSETPKLQESPSVEKEESKKRISPLAKKISKELGVTTDNISGTGPNGRIIRADIEKAAQTQTKPKTKTERQDSHLQPIASPQKEVVFEENKDFRVEKLSNMRKIISAKMLESLQNSAQLTHHLSADARKMLSIRKKIKEAIQAGKATDDITINDLVCFAVIKALKKHPHMNAHFLGDKIKTFHKVHLGLAVDTDRGLMVPVLQNADELNLQGLAHRLKGLARECKDGSISPDLLVSTAASFTISNLGAYGIEMFTPVLNIPQTGILGVNTIIHRPSDLGDGTIGFVPHIGLSLTYDHRAVDGAPASAFLKEIKKQIEELTVDFV